MLSSLAIFGLIASVIAAAWYGLGRPVALPPSPLGSGERITCMSYAPFHGDQAPYTPNLRISDRQIEADLERLAKVTSCIRTYSARGSQSRIVRLAGAPPDEEKVAPDIRWVLSGDRGLTYAATPPAEGTLVAGAWWPALRCG